MSKPKILVVDDDRQYVETLSTLLSPTYQCLHVEDPRRAAEEARKGKADVILLDIRFPEGDIGLDYIEELRAEAPVIMLTSHDDLDTVVESVKRGAYDFFPKDLRLEVLRKKIERCLEEASLRQRYALARGQFIGRSKAAARIRQEILKLSRVDLPVLITGETGVGKTLVAHLIHAHSPRAAREMQVLSGPNLSENRFEAEAFGHCKGAYTDAPEKPGAIELADGSTLLIDEIGDLAPGVQGMFLKVLEEKRVKRMGEAHYREVDFRLLCATNHQIKRMVEEGRFRRDLYERICGIELHIPPLRERVSDVQPLLDHYLKRYAERWGREVPDYDEGFLAVLKSYHWPGNVREVDRLAARVLMKGPAGRLTASDAKELLPTAPRSWDYRENLRAVTLEFKRNFVQRALEYTGGNVTEAAKLMNIARPSLQRIMRETGIKR